AITEVPTKLTGLDRCRQQIPPSTPDHTAVSQHPFRGVLIISQQPVSVENLDKNSGATPQSFVDLFQDPAVLGIREVAKAMKHDDGGIETRSEIYAADIANQESRRLRCARAR